MSEINRAHNFNAGPSILPLSVLEQAQKELIDFKGTGMSVMEISHRSKEFETVIAEAEQDLRSLMGIPANYKVLFLQGGATLQFAMIPMNLRPAGSSADYVVTGSWSKSALKEAQKLGTTKSVFSAETDNFKRIPNQDELKLDPQAASPAATVPIPSANPSTASQPASEGLFDTPTQEPVVTINPPQSESLTKKLAALTVADLAARLSLDANQITVLSTQPVTWPNSALGCPLPGKVYAQSRIPGFRITLQSAGTQYVYNTDQTGTVLFCAAPNSSADDVITPPIQPGDTLGGQIK